MYVCKLKFYYNKAQGNHTRQLDLQLAALWSAWVLNSWETWLIVPLHKQPRLFAERVGATMINVVIKPVHQLLSVTLDHVLRELGCVQWSDGDLWGVHLRKISQSLTVDEKKIAPLIWPSRSENLYYLQRVSFYFRLQLHGSLMVVLYRSFNWGFHFEGARNQDFTAPWHRKDLIFFFCFGRKLDHFLPVALDFLTKCQMRKLFFFKICSSSLLQLPNANQRWCNTVVNIPPTPSPLTQAFIFWRRIWRERIKIDNTFTFWYLCVILEFQYVGFFFYRFCKEFHILVNKCPLWQNTDFHF